MKMPKKQTMAFYKIAYYRENILLTKGKIEIIVERLQMQETRDSMNMQPVFAFEQQALNNNGLRA